MAERTCFVVMGFGTKTDFPTGRTLDLDKTYRSIIRPAVEEAGLCCVRADEVVHAGSIDVAMYQQLLEADVVVADISTCNPNALYELGVRHALRPYTTVIIAEDQITYPFDVNHILIRRYQHLGKGIDFEEANRFRGELTQAIRTLVERAETDSPVYTHLARLRPPVLQQIAEAAAAGAAEAEAEDGSPHDETLGELTVRAEDALRADRFIEAKALFAAARVLRPTDAYLVQRLALATYKTRLPSDVEALEEARALLAELDPEVSNDPETLGLWGSVHKKLWNATGDRGHLDTAVLAHERGFDIRNDAYNGINLAFLLNERARISSPAEQIADFVNAERVRRRVIATCEAMVEAGMRDGDDRFWAAATLSEAYLGIGDVETAERWERRANEEDVAGWMRSSFATQLAALRELLVPSPLDLIRAPGDPR